MKDQKIKDSIEESPSKISKKEDIKLKIKNKKIKNVKNILTNIIS